MKAEEHNKSAAEVEKEGNQVTGGSEHQEDVEQNEEDSSETTGADKANLDEVDKKERMTGYNELPEQEKVGGE